MAVGTGTGREQQDALLLEQFLHTRIAEAMREFQPEPKTLMTWLRPKTPANLKWLLPKVVRNNPLEYKQVAIKGITDSAMLGLSAVIPAGTIYAIGAKVGLELFEVYFNETFRKNLTENRGAADALGYKLVTQDDVASHYKEKVAAMRHCIRATIYAIAEFIEFQSTSVPQLHIELEPAKKRQVDSFINSTHRWRTSYRSMAAALSLFVQENAEIVKRIKYARATQSKETKRLLQLNAVFAFEVADVLIEFLRAFELQGVAELKRLHGEIKSEIIVGRNSLSALETEISSARSSTAISGERAAQKAETIASQRLALNLIQDHWDRLMEKVDGTGQSSSKIFALALQRLEIIKLEAQASLTVAGLIEVTDAVQGNFIALDDMLQDIDKLEVMPITEEEVRLYLNIEPVRLVGEPSVGTAEPHQQVEAVLATDTTPRGGSKAPRRRKQVESLTTTDSPLKVEAVLATDPTPTAAPKAPRRRTETRRTP
jgi:hypothetical protein